MSGDQTPPPAPSPEGVESPSERKKLWTVISASSVGTLIEWYDFYIFGSLAVTLAGQFFPKGNPTAALLSTLATFATGFIVRPFGALVFGRIGDLVGRKHAFLITLLMMGGATFAVGLVPGYAQIGVFAPLLLLLLRLIQGLALGGEYGGAAIYVAEHSPEGKRGLYTSFIQTTATLGLFVSLLVILAVQFSMPKEQFEAYGWRIPFLVSAVLVVISYFIRIKLQESPAFVEMKAEGKGSDHPWRDSFGNKANLKLVLIALFGATMGQGVVWYTGQFYALYFLQTVMSVKAATASTIVAWALILGTPFFIVSGALSDRIGRKKLMMTACLLGAIGYIPIYTAMQSTVPKVDTLGAPSIRYAQTVKDGKPITLKTESWERDGLKATRETPVQSEQNPVSTLTGKEKPKVAIEPTTDMIWKLVGFIFIQVILVTMIYGPIAAFLVELFPVRIRYTSLSLPYHIGNGVFGGLVPFIGTAIVAQTGNPLSGLWYPIAMASITFIVGSLLIRERAPGIEEPAF